MGRDAELLVGLIALSNGLVDQDQLANAFRAWTRGAAARPLGEWLVEQGALDGPQRDAVEALAAQHVRRHGGDPGRSLAALADGGSVRDRLAALADPELSTSLSCAMSSASTEATAAGRLTEPRADGRGGPDGPRFRVLRPHAKGGLGVVLVAMDQELHREVALKEIQDRHAHDPASRARFLLEAEVTGRLEHPGVVPVYSLGHHPDGRPYYAMRLIKGDSLKDAVAAFHADDALRNDPGARSLALRALLRRFVDVCNAVAYAHRRGVVHRDLKPGNVMVGRYGETLVVDWGLAKVVGRDEPARVPEEATLVPHPGSGSAETRAGSAVGTPAYMSPEQAAGDLDRLGPASDVYSLGATLYCLLTGRPPFGEGDVDMVLWAVQRGDFPPPRAVDRSVPPPLEAICLKAMARLPDDRYATPRALADDLERWMADEPVSAYREPLWRRAGRWARRHRAGVAATAAAGLVALAGLAAVLAVKSADNARLRVAFENERRANLALAAANERERSRFDLAMDAIRTFHSGVSDDVLLRRKEFSDLRAKLLGGARAFYDRLQGLLEGQTDRRSREALATAYAEVGRLVSAIGAKADALASYRQALAVRRSLAGPGPMSAEDRDEIAGLLNNIGILLRDTGQPAEALGTYNQAIDTEEALARDHPEAPDYRERLGRFLNNLGLLHAAGGRPAEALAALQRSRAIREGLARARPDVAAYRNDLAVSLSNLGTLYRRSGRTADARAAWGQARDAFEALAREHPGEGEYRRVLAGVLNNLADLDLATGRPDDALAAWGRARELAEGLVRDRPTEIAYQELLADCLMNTGVLLHRTGRVEKALAAYGQARAAYEALAAADPSSAGHRRDLARCLTNLGSIALDLGRPGEARSAFERARDVLAALVAADPSSAGDRNGLAFASHGLGGVHLAAGRPADALAEFDRARALWEALAQEQPGAPEYRDRVALSFASTGDVLAHTGRPAEAVAALDRAVAAWQALADAHPTVVGYRDRLANCLTDLSDALRAAGRPADADAALRRARSLRAALLPDLPADPFAP
jgi:serine/threonine-protein kinase